MRKYLTYRASLFLAALMLPVITHSDVVILTPDSDSARDMAKQIQSQIEAPSRVTHTLEQGAQSELIVAIGESAFRDAMASQSGPVVGTFLSATSAPPAALRPSYRVLSDPSPEAIATFLKRNFNNTSVGYVYSSTEAALINHLQNELENSNVKLVALKASGNTNSDIRSLIRERIDAMFITRNLDIYRPDSIRFTLEQLFRKKIPVITTIPALVKVGATVSIAPSMKAVTSATAESVNAIVAGSLSKGPDLFVDDLDIKVNSSMVELLNVNLQEGAK